MELFCYGDEAVTHAIAESIEKKPLCHLAMDHKLLRVVWTSEVGAWADYETWLLHSSWKTRRLRTSAGRK